ncbi:glycosyltransferase [Anaerostipes butyraticus]|uniref:glycosyltransferase n=1 Tax=Anaerostipes butyraticus TaxID=645466 RepID=UPI00320B192E
MVKILFLIRDLGQGGAEKVLINLVNNLDRTKFDISVTVLFGGGVNERFLRSDINFRVVFPKEIPGNSKLMKILSPQQLHRLCVKERYDIEVAYLEGPSTRVIGGCTNINTKLMAWVHSTIQSRKEVGAAFRSYNECRECYKRFDRVACVSETIFENFGKIFDCKLPLTVIHNTVDSNEIKKKALENIANNIFDANTINIIAVGTLKQVKGYDRLLNIFNNLYKRKYSIHLYILGIGPMITKLEKFVEENELTSCVSFLGYQTNPYKYVARSDLFVCASYSEGFSTAATEALIVGTPICTVEVSGMKEMLGDSEYGLITKNTEEDLYHGIKSLIDNPDRLAYYKKQACLRGKAFSIEETVKKAEEIFLSL